LFLREFVLTLLSRLPLQTLSATPSTEGELFGISPKSQILTLFDKRVAVLSVTLSGLLRSSQ
jgi:hypothetical protein